MSKELQPMAVQYYCHSSPSVSREQYTALPGISGHVIRTFNLTYIGFCIILTQFYVNTIPF